MTHHVHGHEMKPASQMSRLGEVQNEYDHDDGHGAYRCCGPRNGPVDGIRHSQQILLRTNAISPNYPLLASRKIHLRVQRPSPTPVPWLLFLLTTPVYFYSGWIFLYSSFRALQQRTLNMSVLIATGITAAYSFSVLLTTVEMGLRARLLEGLLRLLIVCVP